MKKKVMRMSIVVLVAVLAFSVVGAAAAQGPDRPGPRQGGPAKGRLGDDRLLGSVMQAIQEQTGLTAQDVLSGVRDGKTVAEVITEAGGDPQAIIDQVTQQVTERVTQAVADGKMSQENADQVLSTLGEALNKAMYESLPLPPSPILDRVSQAVEKTLVGTVAEMAGMEPADVLKEWAQAESLAAVVEAHGLDVNAVLAATEAKITEQVNQLVAEDKINEEQAAQFLEGLGERLANRMQSPVPTPVRDRIHDRAQDVIEKTLIGVLAEMAGTDVQTLLRDALTPPTLAEIAQSYGLDANAIIAETEARITEQVNQMVNEGKMTQEQADQLLSGLHDRLVTRFDAPLGRLQPLRDRVPGRFDGPRNRPGQPAGGAGAEA